MGQTTKKRLVLTFPKETIEQPITYHLIKDHNLMVNILRARVNPDEEGELVVEVTGEADQIKRGTAYLKGLRVAIQPLAEGIKWHEDRCTHCTACISICPSSALSLINREDMQVMFDSERCILCQLCIPACPYKAVEILF